MGEIITREPQAWVSGPGSLFLIKQDISMLLNVGCFQSCQESLPFIEPGLEITVASLRMALEALPNEKNLCMKKHTGLYYRKRVLCCRREDDLTD